eukprot:3500316-Rhodomonas_salina.2
MLRHATRKKRVVALHVLDGVTHEACRQRSKVKGQRSKAKGQGSKVKGESSEVKERQKKKALARLKRRRKVFKIGSMTLPRPEISYQLGDGEEDRIACQKQYRRSPLEAVEG